MTQETKICNSVPLKYYLSLTLFVNIYKLR